MCIFFHRLKINPKPNKPVIATAVISIALLISALCASIFGLIVRIGLYYASSKHTFNIYDEHSKFAAIAAGIFFAFFFVTFIFKPHRIEGE
jgi:hypothetical protein